jgi:creatinine amidohydrolase/Fe(II)-dependent formamide hydrolase-like protein
MFVRPDLVDMSGAVSAKAKSKFRVISGLYREEIAPSAMHGDPRPANEEKGKAMMDEAVEELISLIQQLEKGELPIERD